MKTPETAKRAEVAGGNATQAITQALGAAIVTGQYADRPFPSEKELGAQFSAARTIVREAVKMLAAKGLITSRRRQGIRISSEDDWNLLDPDVLGWLLERRFSPQLLLEFMEMRLAVEPAAAALAATRASLPQKAAIHEAVAQMYAAEQTDSDDLAADIAFHLSVLAASGNRFLKQTRVMIATALTISIRYTNDVKGVSGASAKDHDAVAQAIMAGDPETARSAMIHLLSGALELIQSQMK